MNDTTNTTDTPRVLPGVLSRQTLEERDRLQLNLEDANGRRMELVDRRKTTLESIERLQAAVAEYDASIVACDVEREDLIAMDDALAEQYRALERILVRRAGR